MRDLFKNGKYTFVAWGGILTAIIVITAFIGTALSFVEIMLYLSATPIIISVMYGGMRFAVMVGVASAVIISSSLGFFPAGVYFIIAPLPLGLVLGEMYSKKKSSSSIVLLSTFMIALTIFCMFCILGHMTGMDLNRDIAEIATWLKTEPQPLLAVANYALPAALLAIGFIYALYIWFFNSWILNRLKISDRNYLTEIAELFNFPAWFSYLSIFLLFMIAAARFMGNVRMGVAASSFFFLFAMLFFMKGMLLIRPYSFAYLKSPVARLFVALTAFILFPLTAVLGFAATIRGGKQK